MSGTPHTIRFYLDGLMEAKAAAQAHPLPTPARKALVEAESTYLVASGWKRSGKGWLTPNPSYPGRVYTHGHAVNSQKFYEDRAERCGFPDIYGKRFVEFVEQPQPVGIVKLKPWIHPICSTMAEYRQPFEPVFSAEQHLKHHEEHLRRLWPNRSNPNVRKDLRLQIRAIRKGWKPFGGRIIRTTKEGT